MKLLDRPKLVFEIIGSAVGISGIAILFFNQYYTLGIVLLFLTISISYIAINEWLKKPISYKKIDFTYDITDENADITKVRKRKVFDVNEKNITQLQDRNISADGDLIFERTNLGELKEFIGEGGTKSIITSTRAPLEYGKRYTHDIHYKANNVFPKNEESAALLIQYSCDEAGLSVDFPESLFPKSYNLYRSRGGRVDKVEEIKKDEDEKILEFTVQNPKVGDKYILEWEWEK